MPKQKLFSSKYTQCLLSMGNQIATKVDFAKLSFILLGEPVLPKKSLQLFISNLHLLFLMLTLSLRQRQCRNYYKHSYMKKNQNSQFRFAFSTGFRNRFRHTLLNVIKILMKSDKYQRNILPTKKKPLGLRINFSVGKILWFWDFWD